MNNLGPIIVVEDNLDDQFIIEKALSELEVKNEVMMFPDGLAAYTHLTENTLEPFMIISDINMPKMNGMELEEIIQKDTQARLFTVPFIFMSTSEPSDAIIQSNMKLVHRYFKKPAIFEDYKKTLRGIIDFWSRTGEPYF